MNKWPLRTVLNSRPICLFCQPLVMNVGVSQLPKGAIGKEVRPMDELYAFFIEEDAIGVVEIILILVVLIGLVVIFKDQLVKLVKDILGKITTQSNEI